MVRSRPDTPELIGIMQNRTMPTHFIANTIPSSPPPTLKHLLNEEGTIDLTQQGLQSPFA